jgi:hypothetical protein
MAIRISKRLRHVDAPRPAFGRLWDDDGEDSVAQVGGHPFRVDGRRQRECPRELAVSALDLMVLLAWDARVTAAVQRDPAVVHFDANLFA